MANVIELHAVKNFGPNALNREETGRIKTTTVGGYERARFSSASLKRVIRDKFEEDDRNEATRHVVGVLMNDYYLEEYPNAELNEKEIDEITYIMSVVTSLKKDEKGRCVPEYDYGYISEEIRVFSKDELKTLYEYFKEVYADEDLKKQLLKEREAAKKKKQKEKEKNGEQAEGGTTTKKEEAEKESKTVLSIQAEAKKRMQDVRTNLETSVFGKMTASGPGYSVYSSTMFNHPYSVDAFQDEGDTSSTTDTMKRRFGLPGAGRLGSESIASNIFYQYMLIDPVQLYHNLSKNNKDVPKEEIIDVVKRAVEMLVREFATCAPAGKQHAMASAPMPNYLVTTFVKNGTNITMDNCFASVIKEEYGKEPIRITGERLIDYIKNDRLHQNFVVNAFMADSNCRRKLTPSKNEREEREERLKQGGYEWAKDEKLFIDDLPDDVSVMRMNELDPLIEQLAEETEKMLLEL